MDRGHKPQCNRVEESGFFSKVQTRPCNFEPRYDLSEPIGVTKEFLETILQDEYMDDWIESFRRQTYVGEVCTACGQFIARPDAPIKDLA